MDVGAGVGANGHTPHSFYHGHGHRFCERGNVRLTLRGPAAPIPRAPRRETTMHVRRASFLSSDSVRRAQRTVSSAVLLLGVVAVVALVPTGPASADPKVVPP